MKALNSFAINEVPPDAVLMANAFKAWPITFSENGKMVLAINPDGTFQFGEGLDPDEASRRAVRIFAEYLGLRKPYLGGQE